MIGALVFGRRLRRMPAKRPLLAAIMALGAVACVLLLGPAGDPVSA